MAHHAYLGREEGADLGGIVRSLEGAGYKVHEKPVRRRRDGSGKADWDMGMAMEIMNAVEKLDVVVIASGDGDFADLVREVKRRGPRVEVWSIRESTSRDLIEVADRCVPLSESFVYRYIDAPEVSKGA